MIETITKEQEQEIKELRERWLAIGRSTNPIDKIRVGKVLTTMYEKLGKKKPVFYFCDSPKACMDKYKELTGKDCSLGDSMGGSWWCYPEVFYDGGRKIGVQYSKEDNVLLDMWLEQSEACHIWFPYENAVFVSERPTKISLNAMGRLDCKDGPALQYKDGYGIYNINGIRVDKKYIEEPLTVEIIDSVTNVEQHRVLIEKYGTAKYVQESGAKLVHRDDWGELYEKERKGDTPLRMVKVVNSTPEPDGTFKDYWLRPSHQSYDIKRKRIVDERPETACAAIASTFLVPFVAKCNVYARQGDVLLVKTDGTEDVGDNRPLTEDEYKMVKFQS